MRLSLPAHMHAAGSVAALFDFNLETTPVQLRTILFQTRDPTGRGISSYLVVLVCGYSIGPTPRYPPRAFTSSLCIRALQ